jgi:hypothetical protein
MKWIKIHESRSPSLALFLIAKCDLVEDYLRVVGKAARSKSFFAGSVLPDSIGKSQSVFASATSQLLPGSLIPAIAKVSAAE